MVSTRHQARGDNILGMRIVMLGMALLLAGCGGRPGDAAVLSGCKQSVTDMAVAEGSIFKIKDVTGEVYWQGDVGELRGGAVQLTNTREGRDGELALKCHFSGGHYFTTVSSN